MRAWRAARGARAKRRARREKQNCHRLPPPGRLAAGRMAAASGCFYHSPYLLHAWRTVDEKRSPSKTRAQNAGAQRACQNAGVKLVCHTATLPSFPFPFPFFPVSPVYLLHACLSQCHCTDYSLSFSGWMDMFSLWLVET